MRIVESFRSDNEHFGLRRITCQVRFDAGEPILDQIQQVLEQELGDENLEFKIGIKISSESLRPFSIAFRKYLVLSEIKSTIESQFHKLSQSNKVLGVANDLTKFEISILNIR